MIIPNQFSLSLGILCTSKRPFLMTSEVVLETRPLLTEYTFGDYFDMLRSMERTVPQLICLILYSLIFCCSL